MESYLIYGVYAYIFYAERGDTMKPKGYKYIDSRLSTDWQRTGEYFVLTGYFVSIEYSHEKGMWIVWDGAEWRRGLLRRKIGTKSKNPETILKYVSKNFSKVVKPTARKP